MPNSASTWRRTCRPIRNNAKNTFLYNYEFWADYRDDLDAKFQAWLAKTVMMQSPGVADILPETASAWQSWQRIVANKNDVLAEEQPEDFIYTMLYRDLVAQPASAITAYSGAGAEMLQTADSAVDGFEVISLREQFLDIDEDWADPQIWGTIKAFSSPYTAGYFLSSVDLQLTPAGVEAQPENQQIYMLLFGARCS
jgi:putative spermidine/putrescine transport system permease protein